MSHVKVNRLAYSLNRNTQWRCRDMNKESGGIKPEFLDQGTSAHDGSSIFSL